MATRTSQPEGAVRDEAQRGKRLLGLADYGMREQDVPDHKNGGPVRWFFTFIWLVYLIAPVSGLFGRGHKGVLYIAGGLAITTAFCVIYVLLLMRTTDERTRWHIGGVAAIGALSGLAAVVYGKDWTSLWIYVSAAVGLVAAARPVSRRAVFRSIVAVGLCYSFFSLLSHDNWGDFLATLLPVVLIGYAMVGFRMQTLLLRDLKQARDTVAKLAVSEERLRLARDMHDLTGQSLSMITLKSDLAIKRLDRLPDSAAKDAIRGELADIGRVSRQTLHDIREAVSGYRRPTLAIEVITARTTLEAAGIQLDDDPGLITLSGSFDAEREAALAWCLREAVTNVVRHSGARQCRIRLIRRGSELALEITDDGGGLATQDGPGGSGLRGMSERLSAVGGALQIGAAGTGRGDGFKLTAIVPEAGTVLS